MLGMLAAAVVLPKSLAIATMWAAAAGDPATALVGRLDDNLRITLVVGAMMIALRMFAA
jgi:dolichol kinase